MNILVTGGLGFIGSHTCVELIEKGHHVIIVDSLINSKIEVLDKIEQITAKRPIFYKLDVTNEAELDKVFKDNTIDGIIHFAGLKAIGESLEKPILYYYNNLVSTMVLSKLCLKYDVEKFVFSSSATVYGEQKSPLKEDMELGKTTNPYGETKVMSERILTDVANENPKFSVSLLRYFNPIGAHKSALIGESPNGIPNNLMPYITKVAKGELSELQIYGNDYNTADGTGVRDYIHVVDLAKGHVKAIENMAKGVKIYNLGTGKGTSVLELLDSFIHVNRVDVANKIVERRAGDIAVCYADVTKAQIELGWRAELSIEDMVRDSWRFENGKDNS